MITVTANQNPSCFKELERLKRQTTKLEHALINRTLLSVGVECVDANSYQYTVVVFIVIVPGVNGPFILFHQLVSDSTEQ